MIPLVEFPTIVQHYAPFFRSVFSPEAFIQFQRYLSGLLISENKTVEGLNRLCVCAPRHQSSLNRFMTQSPYTLATLEQQRLALLASLPGTALKRRGVLSIDDTLLTHYGQHFEKIAYLYDHTNDNYTWAHNLVSLHYSDDLTDYPVRYQLWEPIEVAALEEGLLAAGVELRASKYVLKTSAPRKWRQYLQGVWRRHRTEPAVAKLYQTKLHIAKQLLKDWCRHYPVPALPVTFDSWYTEPNFCQYLDQTLRVAYVGTLNPSDTLELKTGTETLAQFADRLVAEHEAAQRQGQPPVFKPHTIRYKGTRETYYSYCATHNLTQFGRHRLVINYDQADLSDTPMFLMSNRRYWQAPGITRIRRHRWPIEVYYEEAKAEGLAQYQLRDFAAVQRHVALVAVVYSLLRAAQHDSSLRDKLQCQLKLPALEGSVPYWRRVTQAEALWNLALFIEAGLAQGQTLHSLLAPLVQAVTA